MSFFGDDMFDDIVREFLGDGRSRTRSYGNVVRGEKEERVIDFIDEENYVYLVFELPGYSKNDIDVEISGDIVEVSAVKKNLENVQDYLSNKLSKGVYYKKTIPGKVKIKKMEKKFKNGILELAFPKK